MQNVVIATFFEGIMLLNKAIILLSSFYFCFYNLKIEKHPGVFVFHFLMLFAECAPSVNLENVYKDACSIVAFRADADSGLEIGCFIIPLVLLSQIIFGRQNPFILEDHWQLYHSATVLMGLCTLLMLLVVKGSRNLTTLTTISLICLAIANTGDFQWKGNTNEIFLITCLLLYFTILLFIMKTLPYSFTLGEAMVVTQTIVILLVDYMFSIYSRLSFIFPSPYFPTVTTVDELPFTRTEITYILQTLVVGTLITGLLLLPVFYYISVVSEPIEQWIGTLSFYAICLLSFMAIFLPSFYMTLGGINPVMWAYQFLNLNPTRIRLCVYWLFIVLVAFATVVWKAHRWTKVDNELRLPNIIIRKIFHILAVAIFVPGILYDPSLLHLCSSVAASLFLLLEFIRVGRIKPFGVLLHGYLSPLVDSRDSGPLVLTHLYLLIGCAMPLWLYPLDYNNLSHSGCELLLYSGVLSIGLGDSAASIVGIKFGSHYWKGTKKTMEGTAASVLIQIFALLSLSLSVGLRFNAVSAGMVIILSSLLEAFTSQIDNFVLPSFTYSLLAMTCTK